MSISVAESVLLECSLFGRRSRDLGAASTVAAAPIVPESPRSQPSFEAERAQYAEDLASLAAEKAKQQASTCNFFWGLCTNLMVSTV